MDFEELFNNANKGDYESQYRLALAYRNGRGVDKSERESKFWFEKAIVSNRAYILNDYVAFLLSSGETIGEEDVYSYLSRGLKDNNPQSIRLYGKYLLEQSDKKELGKVLLRYATELGNEWAISDLIKRLYSEKTVPSAKEIISLGKEYCSMHNEIQDYVFQVAVGSISGYSDFDFAKKLLNLSKSNPFQYLHYIEILKRNPRTEYSELIDVAYLLTSPELKIVLSELYRDGTILDRDLVKSVSILSSIPENYLNKM